MPLGTGNPRYCGNSLRPMSILHTTLTPVISNGVAYAANDVVGGLLSFNIDSKLRNGMVVHASIGDAINLKAGLDLYLFSSLPTSFADNAAFAPTMSDFSKMFGPISFPSSIYKTFGTRALATVHDPAIITYKTDTNVLYGYLISNGTPTYTATNALQVSLLLWEA